VKTGETLFTVYAKAGAEVPKDRYLAALNLQATKAPKYPWLLDTIE